MKQSNKKENIASWSARSKIRGRISSLSDPPSNLVRTRFCTCSCGSLPPDESIMVSLSWSEKWGHKDMVRGILMACLLFCFRLHTGWRPIISSLFVLGRKKRAPSVCLLKWGCMMACRDSKGHWTVVTLREESEASNPHITPSETKQCYMYHDHPNWWRRYACRNPHGCEIP